MGDDDTKQPSLISKKVPKSLQVRLITKQKEYAVPDYPYEISSGVGPEALNNLVNKVLQDDGALKSSKSFDFLVGGEFLRGSLEELIVRHELLREQNEGSEASKTESLVKIGTEELFDVEYVEKWPSPEPKDCVLHDDWVSTVDATSDWILTGCYDATVHMWTSAGKHKEVFVGHEGPVKKVKWISNKNNSAVFVSASHDQSLKIWELDLSNNNASCKRTCTGHERSVESLAVNSVTMKIASGSWDGHLKIWSASLEETAEDSKAEIAGKSMTRTPLLTMAAHKESISALAWCSSSEILSASWDHTIKIWDIEGSQVKSDLSGNKAFFDMSWSPLNNTIVTSSADRHIRLYDPRSSEGSIVKSMFTSHSGWVSSVNWSTTSENLFISGSHDKLTKVWDRRSPRTPLYNLTGHNENILCTSWSNPESILSGGADNTLRIYSAKVDF